MHWEQYSPYWANTADSKLTHTTLSSGKPNLTQPNHWEQFSSHHIHKIVVTYFSTNQVNPGISLVRTTNRSDGPVRALMSESAR